MAKQKNAFKTRKNRKKHSSKGASRRSNRQQSRRSGMDTINRVYSLLNIPYAPDVAVEAAIVESDHFMLLHYPGYGVVVSAEDEVCGYHLIGDGGEVLCPVGVVSNSHGTRIHCYAIPYLREDGNYVFGTTDWSLAITKVKDGMPVEAKEGPYPEEYRPKERQLRRDAQSEARQEGFDNE